MSRNIKMSPGQVTGIRRTLRRFAAVSISVVLLATGCGSRGNTGQASSTPAAPPAGWPAELNDFTVDWTAEPGIDLTSWPGVAIRAYVESYLLASITGDDKYLYPGFKQAVDPNKSVDNPTGTRFLWPKTDGPRENPWVGTESAHILSATRSGREVTVVVCEYLFGTAQLGQHGGYTPNIAEAPPDSGIDPMRMTMTAPADAGPKKPPQVGPARTPSVDVFNGWRITSHQGGPFAEYGLQSEWPDIDHDTDKCRIIAPKHPDLARGGEYPRSSFPTELPSPGWPAATPAS